MIHNPQEFVEKSKIYLGDARVMIKEEKDLIPYYTHLISSACYNKESGNTIHLSRNSFIDSEEREHIAWRVRDVIGVFRKAKKEKVDVTLDYMKKQKFWWNDSDVIIWKALVDKVKNNSDLRKQLVGYILCCVVTINNLLINNMDLIKVHLPKDYRECSYFISEWLIPNYFYDIHDSMHNRFREEFVKFAHENGYSTFEDDKGIYHPIIWKMCYSIEEYKKMNEKYGGNI